MDEGFDTGGDVGGDVGGDISSDVGSDIGGDSGADFSSDLASDDGADLNGDIDTDLGGDMDADTGADTDAEIGDGSGENLNGDAGENVDYGMDIDADAGMDESVGDDLNADDGIDENIGEDSGIPDGVSEDINTEDGVSETDSDLGDDAGGDSASEQGSTDDATAETDDNLNTDTDTDIPDTGSDSDEETSDDLATDSTDEAGIDLNDEPGDASDSEADDNNVDEELNEELSGDEVLGESSIDSLDSPDNQDDNSFDTAQEGLDNSKPVSYDNDVVNDGDPVENEAFDNETEDVQQPVADGQGSDNTNDNQVGDEPENAEQPDDGEPLGSNIQDEGDSSDEEKEPIKEFTESPYNDDGSLKPNIEYTTGEYDYHYETDDQGRITGFRANNLQLTEREKRLPHNSQTPDKRAFDDAGHLIGDRFGGSPELDNLVSQDSSINRVDYNTMEKEWAKALRNGSHVEVAGDVSYDSDSHSHRPSSFDVFYTIDGEMYERSFLNRRD